MKLESRAQCPVEALCGEGEIIYSIYQMVAWMTTKYVSSINIRGLSDYFERLFLVLLYAMVLHI